MTTQFHASCAADLAALVVHHVPAAYRPIADAAIAAARCDDDDRTFAMRCAQTGLLLVDSGQPRAAAAMYAAANAASLVYAGDSCRQAVLDALKHNLAEAGL